MASYVDYSDLADYETREYKDWRYYLDKFITTPKEYQNYQKQVEQLEQENQYLKEQNIENTIDIPTPSITGDKTIDTILLFVGIFVVFKNL